jgi:hypothetical protein
MFKDTANKSVIRTRWSLPIIQEYARQLGRPLNYFGMPGPRVLDLIAWKGSLGLKTAVQIVRSGRQQREEDSEAVSNILMNAANAGVATQFQLLRGAVEDVILNGIDIDGAKPSLAQMQKGDQVRFTYDLFNLDFEGGIHYKAASTKRGNSGSLRLKALEKLFERQQGHDFLLFLTLNVRDTLGDEPIKYLLETAERCANKAVQEVVQWTVALSDGNKHIQLATWLPIYIKEQAEIHQFACESLPPISYEGCDRARMVHFTFLCAYVPDRNLRVASPQGYPDLVALPILQAADDQLKQFPVQNPHTDATAIERSGLFNKLAEKVFKTVSQADLVAHHK